MDPRRLRYFLAVVDSMHFGRAAEHLGMTQPALSQQIRRLEQEVGVDLFDRSRRRVELTDAGRALAADGRALVDHHDKVSAATRGAGRGEVGTVRLSMVGSAVIGMLPRLMVLFGDRYPQARLDLAEVPSGMRQSEAIRERRIDAGVLRYPPAPVDDVVIEPLTDEELVVALPAEHPLARRDRVAAAALEEEPFVLWPRSHAPSLYDQVFSAAGSLGFAPRVRQQVNGVQANLALVAAGAGVSVLPESVRMLSRQGVVFRPFEPPAPTSTLAAAWHRDNHAPLLSSLLGALREVAGTSQGPPGTCGLLNSASCWSEVGPTGEVR